MPILTKAAAPVKGTATLFTLDKAALATVTSVAADAYFSDSANWKSVSLLYHSSIGNQHEVVKFEASQSSPTSKFLVSEQSRDIFEIQKIVIKDFDGGTFEVLRSELTTAEFDVDMASAPSTSYTFSNALKSSDITLSNGNLTATKTSSSGGYCSALIDNAFMLSGSQKIYLELTVDRMTTSGVEAFGFVFQTDTPSVFNSGSVTIPGFYGIDGPRIVWQGITLYKKGTESGYVALETLGNMLTGEVIGIAVDIQSQTFSVNRNGTWSSTYIFSDIVGVADRIYFAVGPNSFTPGSEDSFTKNISSTHTPFGYTLI